MLIALASELGREFLAQLDAAHGRAESEALSVVRLSYDQNLGDEAMRLVVDAIASASARLA